MAFSVDSCIPLQPLWISLNLLGLATATLAFSGRADDKAGGRDVKAKTKTVLVRFPQRLGIGLALVAVSFGTLFAQRQGLVSCLTIRTILAAIPTLPAFVDMAMSRPKAAFSLVAALGAYLLALLVARGAADGPARVARMNTNLFFWGTAVAVFWGLYTVFFSMLPPPAALLGSAESNNGNAQYILGDMYQNGTGLRKDPERAYFWYSLAAARGVKAAAAARDDVSADLSPEQLQALELSVENWNIQHPAPAEKAKPAPSR